MMENGILTVKRKWYGLKVIQEIEQKETDTCLDVQGVREGETGKGKGPEIRLPVFELDCHLLLCNSANSGLNFFPVSTNFNLYKMEVLTST